MMRKIIEATVAMALAAAPASAQCIGDANNNGFVNFADYGAVAQNFGQPCSPETRFVDNNDGTITDRWNGLIWEKMSRDLSVHDVSDAYTWGDATGLKIATLNATAFAGFTDWRLPTMTELLALVDFTTDNPATFAPFKDVNCEPFCTVLTCSCTHDIDYWSSTPRSPQNIGYWYVTFGNGDTNSSLPNDLRRVRAVRNAY